MLVAVLPFAGCSLPVDDVKLSRASLGRVDFTPNPNMVTAAVAHIECKGSVAVDFYVPSLDGKYVAAALSENGSEDASGHIFEVATGK